MKPRTYTLIYTILFIITFLNSIEGNQPQKVPKIQYSDEDKAYYSNEAKEQKAQRKLENSNYITITFDGGFETDTCWFTRYETYISEVKLSDVTKENFKSTFSISEEDNLQIYFSTQLADLSYFLGYDKNSNEISQECKDITTFKSHIVSIDFSNFDDSLVTSGANMFAGYSNLKSVDLSYFENAKFEDVSAMFYQCSKLETINLGNIDISAATDLSFMFSECSSLISVDLSKMDISSVVDMTYMFSECFSLKSVDFSNLVTTILEIMEGMFESCYSLESADLSSFNTPVLSTIDNLFYDCISLKSVDLSNFDTSNLESMKFIFHNCTSLRSIDLSNWDVSGVTDMMNIFYECTSLVALEIPNFFMYLLMNSDNTLTNVNKLRYINIENMKYNLNADYSEGNCANDNCVLPINYESDPVIVCQNNPFLTNANIYEICCSFNADTEMCESDNYIILYFNQDYNYETGFKNSYRNDINFINCDNKTITDSAALNIKAGTKMEIHFKSSVTNMEKFFSQAEDENMINLVSIDLSHFNSSSVTNMNSMFSGCSSLQSINLLTLNTQKVTDMANMFSGCSSLTSLDVTGFNTANVENMNAMFSGCIELNSINLLNFDTLKVINMASMFENCQSLTSIDLSKFNTEKVENMNAMFSQCNNLKILNLSNFDTSLVQTMDSMFYNCNALNILDISNFNMEQITSNNQMLNGLTNLNFINTENIKMKDGITLELTVENGHLIACQKDAIFTSESENIYNICCSYNSETGLCESTNYIKLTFNQACNYENGFKNNYRNISFINSGGSTITDSIELNINTGTELEIHFNSPITNMEKFFSQAEDNNMINVISIDLSHFDSSSVTNMNAMFSGCNSLQSINLININTQNVNNMAYIFYGCQTLTSLDVTGFNTANVENMNAMFSGCIELNSINLLNFDTLKVINMASMFENCQSLTSIDLSKFNTEKVENMNAMFSQCNNLKILNLSNFDTSLVQTMDSMFYNCNALNILDISNFNMEQITSNNQMLNGLTNLNFINLYNIKDNGYLSGSALNSDNSRENVFYVCQKTNIITNTKSLNCCNYYDNAPHCDDTKEISTILDISTILKEKGAISSTILDIITPKNPIITNGITNPDFIN